MCPWPEKRIEGRMGIPEKVALNSQLLKASSMFTDLLSHGVPFSLTPGHSPSLLTQAKSLGPLPSRCILFFSSPSTKRSSENAKSQGKRAERSINKLPSVTPVKNNVHRSSVKRLNYDQTNQKSKSVYLNELWF